MNWAEGEGAEAAGEWQKSTDTATTARTKDRMKRVIGDKLFRDTTHVDTATRRPDQLQMRQG
jgi:hypothetical protein